MDGYGILFAFLKIFVVIMFVMNTAALLTWGERRQSAMIQDRIGPNRAVIYLPSIAIKVLSLAAGGGAALLVAGYTAMMARRSEVARLDGGLAVTELAIFLTWLGLVVVRRGMRARGHTGFLAGLDARLIFYVGLALHVLAVVLRANASDGDSALGKIILCYVGPLVAVAILAGAGFRGFTKVPAGKVGVRLGGTLHALADGAKMAFKEDFVPTNADRLLHSLGPIISLFPVFVIFAVVPFGDTLCLHIDRTGHFFSDLFQARIGEVTGNGFSSVVARSGVCSTDAVNMQVANLNIGILFMFALAGTGIIGAAVAGWSSDNKFSLLGGLRAASQMVSYEVALGLSLVGAFMTYGSVRLDDMVRWQGEHAWGIFVQPLGFILFLTASIAENKRVPFDSPEGESEIVAGYFLEYSGLKFGMFMLGEYMELAISSAVLTTIFFGGYSLPFLHRDGITLAIGDNVYFQMKMAHATVILLGVIAFFVKTWFVCFVQLFIRWTIPRFRYDQIMSLGWKVLLPAAILNMFVSGVVLLAIGEGGVGLSNALDVAGDLTQALVLVGTVVGVIALISGLLSPRRRFARSVSSSAGFAEAKGGTKLTPMQA
jgi:NADH-quinone oxidoreductase subunit H